MAIKLDQKALDLVKKLDSIALNLVAKKFKAARSGWTDTPNIIESWWREALMLFGFSGGKT
jgi:hypothetical protein